MFVTGVQTCALPICVALFLARDALGVELVELLIEDLLWLHLCYRKEHLGSPAMKGLLKRPWNR